MSVANEHLKNADKTEDWDLRPLEVFMKKKKTQKTYFLDSWFTGHFEDQFKPVIVENQVGAMADTEGESHSSTTWSQKKCS